MSINSFKRTVCLASVMLALSLFLPVPATAATAVTQQTTARTIRGTVKDSSGEPLIGAYVVVTVSGNTVGAITEVDGTWSLQIPKGDFNLEVTCLGFVNATVKVLPGQDVYDIVLQEDSEMIEETVVVAFGKQKKETVTGAISAVQTKELTQSPQANISNMLVGRLPGLLAAQRSGEPGEDASTLRIRGVATFAGSADPLIMVDGIETSNYNNIDPNEIESLSILKDASATAVYGVRGANGVILITTRRGAEGKPTISYSGNVAVNRFMDIRETLNSEEYATMYNEAQKYDGYITGGYNPRFTDEEIAKYRNHSDPILYPDINWYELMLKKSSMTTQHNVNVSGGTDKAKYFISAGYYNQQGLFGSTDLMEGFKVQSSFERFNFRANTDFKVTKRLTVNVNLASQMQTKNGNAGDTKRIMDYIARARPMLTPGIVDGKIVELDSGGDNPLYFLYQNGYRVNFSNTLNGSVGLNYDIPGIKGLKATAKFSYENFYSHVETYSKSPLLTYTVRRNDADELVFTSKTTDKPFSYATYFTKNRRYYIEAGLSYDTKIAENHHLTALLLYNQSRRFDPNLTYKIPNSYQGIVGRVTYDYKKRYLAEINVGYNGTENFAPGKRFGLFPAYSLGWVVSEEPFFPKNDWVTFLKIRGSYGEVGNDKVGGTRFLYLPTAYVSASGSYHFGTPNSNYSTYSNLQEGTLGNEDLTWERAKKANIGFETTLFKSRLRISADYFREDRSNILANRSNYSVVFGATPPAMNFGEMSNQGFDGDISFQDMIGDFSYWVRGNYTFARNKVIFRDEIPNPYKYRQSTGQILNQYFGLICDGFYNTWEEVNDPNRPESTWSGNKLQPGDLKYRDINGDGYLNSDDYVPIGYSNFPEIVYGFSLGGNWKGLDFSILFQGATHVSYEYPRLYKYGFGEMFSAPRTLLDSWTAEKYAAGEEILFPHLSIGNESQTHNYTSSTFWTRDASYLRLKNVEIGYTFDKKTMRFLRINSARIFVNGNNVLTWSKMIKGVDPEANNPGDNYAPYPPTQTFNIGVNLKF